MAGRKKRNGGCGCGGMCGNPKCRNPSLNVRNPVHTGSEDYRIGLFQGAIEKGKIPPPHNTSADLRRGYADGAKVAKAKPTMVAEALGVYKATGNQQQAGAVLYNEVKGESVATLRNPSLNVRNPKKVEESPSKALSSAIQTKNAEKIKKAIDQFYKLMGVEVQYEFLGAFRMDQEKEKWFYELGSRTQSRLVNLLKKLRDMRWSAAPETLKHLDPRQQAFLQEIVAEMTWAEKVIKENRKVKRNPSLNVRNPSLAARRNPSLNVRNPMSAAARKHLAHEKGEEKAFASMMAALAEGVTVKVGAHRVRKLSKGYVVVDGERLTTTQAARKLHRGK